MAYKAQYSCPLRASTTGQTIPRQQENCKAIRSRLTKEESGSFKAMDKPFIAAMPIRSPLKEPGPRQTAS